MATSKFSLVTLEEHYLSPSFEADAEIAELYSSFPDATTASLREIGNARIANMDEGGVDVQVISHGPGAGNATQCREANDHLARAIQTNPTRFRGFAALPMAEPSAAVEELQRCIQTLDFVGALVENGTDGRYYDDKFFWPVFQMAQELDVPIYIHPTFPNDDLARQYSGNYGAKETISLGAFGWGWHADTGLHLLKLYAAGLFDKFPQLKLVIGHMGEMVPFQLSRVIRCADRGLLGEKKRGFRQVWDENIWITTSGMFDLAPMSCLLRAAKIDRILYSVDFPFSNNIDGAAFLERLEQSGLVTQDQLNLIAHANARSLLKLH